MRRVALSSFALALVACGSSGNGPDDGECPPGSTSYGCHDAGLADAARGAVDAAPHVAPDARAPACNDGVREPDEVCGALVTVDTSGSAMSARLVDLDHDGALDLAYLSPDHLVFRLGDGHGAFGAAVNGPAVVATRLAVADVNNDGFIDLVTAGTGEVDVWYGTATGIGAAAVPGVIALGDSVIDIATANTDGFAGSEIVIATTSTYQIWSGVGASPSRIVTYTVGSNEQVISLGVGDYNHDTYTDGMIGVLTTSSTGEVSTYIRILESTAYGFELPYESPPEGEDAAGTQIQAAVITAVTATDIFGDGTDHLLLAQANPAQLSVSGSTVVGGSTSLLDSIALGDLEGSSYLDVVTTGRSPDELQIWSGYRFALKAAVSTRVALPASVTSMHVDGDVNGDGIADPVLTLGDRIAVYLSSPP